MGGRIFFALGLFTVCYGAAIPLDRQAGKYDHLQNQWELSGKFQGDILDPDDDVRNGLIKEIWRWPNQTMVYFIDPFFDEDQHNLILTAMEEITNKTCVKMREMVEGDRSYVHFHGNQNGCFAVIGKQEIPQRLNLGPGCIHHGIIIHEMLHSLGFHHMQSASDRDDYVIIHFENIILADEPNFWKFPNTTVTDYGEPYDYGSIMHYSTHAFTINGEPTITTIDPEAVIGQRVGLSESDIIKINAMYKCDEVDEDYEEETDIYVDISFKPVEGNYDEVL